MTRLLSLLVLSLTLFTFVKAQKSVDMDYNECSQWYDKQKVIVIEGTITLVKQISTTKDMTFGTHILVGHEGEEIEVHLGPSWYLEKKRIKVRTGEIVKVSGSLCILEGKPSMIAQWMVKQKDTIQLRDDEGFPIWAKVGNNKSGGRNRRFKSYF